MALDSESPARKANEIESRRNPDMCFECPLRRTCAQICMYVENQLPSMETGRVDQEDMERLYHGRIMTHALLDNVDILSDRQQQVVQLYYRENRQQREIAQVLSISQQAVGDALVRAKTAVGNKLSGHCRFSLEGREA